MDGKRPARCFIMMNSLPRIGREIPAAAPFEIAHGVQLTGHFPIVRIIRIVIPLGADGAFIAIFLQNGEDLAPIGVAKAREALGSNPGLALELYSALSGYMVTDITLDEVNYLASIILDYSFSGDRIYSLEGETVVGDWNFEEFYPDEEALYELILDIFYEPV